ncbi:iron chaperone [Chengkuizengella axinellae]|uniref:DUF1801 domain-containing protein n=1 Tax=Chengkuizengella axinellae TaxID=3064388 RepID=A0ABT9J490_9BACL|nr:DUF1801 domain-containing protein [Chengkuizengella sp. 2205SS18-9]MDP5276461.1 DUF1801 domain-containing protein [Chengkuizengella sp. 2205SS18-9]
MQLVNDYMSNLDGVKKEWTEHLVQFMREVFPELEESFHYKMPTYRGDGYFIAFAAQKNYFSFYTDDLRVLSLIKELIPSASMGKSCARIKYTIEFAIEVLMDVCKEIVDYHNAKSSSEITDFESLRKWSDIPTHVQKILLDNVFCSNCGVTTILDYNIQNDRLGLVLKGSCKKCGGKVARLVEDE